MQAHTVAYIHFQFAISIMTAKYIIKISLNNFQCTME